MAHCGLVTIIIVNGSMQTLKANMKFLEAYSQYAQRAIIARALAHPLRLAILAKLAAAPQTQADLRKGLKPWVANQTLGPHLAALKQVGLIKQEARGDYYQLSHPLIAATVDDLLGMLWGLSQLGPRARTEAAADL